MLDHRDGPDSFLDAETATFASRIKRLIKTKADELQKCVPGRSQRGSESGRGILMSCSMLHGPEAMSCAGQAAARCHITGMTSSSVLEAGVCRRAGL